MQLVQIEFVLTEERPFLIPPFFPVSGSWTKVIDYKVLTAPAESPTRRCFRGLRCCECVDECLPVPFWWCTSAWWRRTPAACAPRGLCSQVFSPYKSWPASAPTWRLPPGASALCPCCRSQRCESGQSPAVSWSPTGRRTSVVKKNQKGSAEKQYKGDFAVVDGASPAMTCLHLSKAVVGHFVHKAIE